MKRVIKPKPTVSAKPEKSPAKSEKSEKPEKSPAKSEKSEKSEKSKKSEKPEKTEKPQKPKTKDELLTNEELRQRKFKVIVTAKTKSFKVLGFKTDKKLSDNKYVYMCSKSKELKEVIANDKYGFELEIIVDKDKLRCKPRGKGIKEIKIALNN